MEFQIAQLAQLAYQPLKQASELQVIFVDDDAEDREIISEHGQSSARYTICGFG